jgi:uncharacterized protein YxeA
MDLKTLKKILLTLIEDKILSSELINISSTIYEEDDVIKRNVYIRYDLNEKKYKRDKKQIRKIIYYLIKTYEKELINAPMIVIFDQVVEENGVIKRYVGFDYPIYMKNRKDKIDLMYI